MGNTYKEAAEFASFLVDNLQHEEQALNIAYAILNKLNVKWWTLDNSDIRDAIANVCDYREYVTPQGDDLEAVVKHVIGTTDWEYLDADSGMDETREELERIVMDSLEYLGYGPEEEEEEEYYDDGYDDEEDA